jgi:hypothetical protein
VVRVSHRGERIDDADRIAGARQMVRGQAPGHYDVDEIRAEPFPSGRTSRGWVVSSGIQTGGSRSSSIPDRIANGPLLKPGSLRDKR